MECEGMKKANNNIQITGDYIMDTAKTIESKAVETRKATMSATLNLVNKMINTLQGKEGEALTAETNKEAIEFIELLLVRIATPANLVITEKSARYAELYEKYTADSVVNELLKLLGINDFVASLPAETAKAFMKAFNKRKAEVRRK